MTSTQKFDRQGKPISIKEWAVKFEDADYKRVAYDEIEEFEVSTVWLGDDGRSTVKNGRPMIFETMVFGLDGSGTKYATEDEALAGHARYVAWLRGEGDDPESTFKDRATTATDEALRLLRRSVPGARAIIVLEGYGDDNHLAVGNPRSGEKGEWSIGGMIDTLGNAARALEGQNLDTRYSW